MAFKEELIRQGSWLFRWRSYIPCLALPLLVLALREPGAQRPVLGISPEISWLVVGFAVALLGLLVRAVAAGMAPAGTSSRKTTGLSAEQLNTTGLYSVLRHPLYLGNFLAMLGVTLVLGVWWFPIICILLFALYYERIILLEENFLEERFTAAFYAWAARTPAFLPAPRLWQPPNLSFSLRAVLKREHTAPFTLTAALSLIALLHGKFTGEGWCLAAPLQYADALTFLFLLCMLALKKLHMLEAPGH